MVIFVREKLTASSKYRTKILETLELRKARLIRCFVHVFHNIITYGSVNKYVYRTISGSFAIYLHRIKMKNG